MLVEKLTTRNIPVIKAIRFGAKDWSWFVKTVSNGAISYGPKFKRFSAKSSHDSSTGIKEKFPPHAINRHLIKSNLSVHSLYYAEACKEFAEPISTSLRPGNTAPFEEVLQRWPAVVNTVSDSTGPRFEPRISRSRNEDVITWPTSRSNWKKERWYLPYMAEPS